MEPCHGGIKKASVWSPEMTALSIKKSRRPLFVIGSLLNSVPEITERVVKIVKRRGITVAATGGSASALKKAGLNDFNVIGAIEIVNNLKNPEWKGFDGKGNYDLVIFIGVPYYLGSQGLSTLKHFAPHIRTLTLCRYMHPNADMSFPNMEYEKWVKWLSELEGSLKT